MKKPVLSLEIRFELMEMIQDAIERIQNDTTRTTKQKQPELKRWKIRLEEQMEQIRKL